MTIEENGKLLIPAGVTAQASKYVFGGTTFRTPLRVVAGLSGL